MLDAGRACAICSPLASVAMTVAKYRAKSRAACPFPVAQSQATSRCGACDAMKRNSASG
jgi:hypothetical protein